MSNTSSKPAKHSRLPSLDGFRALAIAAVLTQHCYGKPGWPESLNTPLLSAVGGVGVRLFFVLSGFLITYLMLHEFNSRGGFSLQAFYLRRSLRIFPIYFLYIAVIGIAATGGIVVVHRAEWLRALTFTVDFGGGGPQLGHLWTLGVEEKFYLLWPPVAACLGLSRPDRLISVLAIPILLCPVLRCFEGFNSGSMLLDALFFSHHSFFTIADGLAIGCVGGIAWITYPHSVAAFCDRHCFRLLAVGTTLVLTPVAFWTIPSLEVMKPLQDTIQGLGFLLLVLTGVSCPDRSILNILSLTLITRIGLISYSLYMWMPLFEIPTGSTPSFLPWPYGFPHWLLALFLAATASYSFIEQPALRLKKRMLLS